MILLIDNYDSFTYNLYQFIGTFNNDIKVVRNDKITIEEIEDLNPESIVISPGPKSPKEADLSGDHPPFCGKEADAWNLSGTSVYRRSIWRNGFLCKENLSWKTVADRT